MEARKEGRCLGLEDKHSFGLHQNGEMRRGRAIFSLFLYLELLSKNDFLTRLLEGKSENGIASHMGLVIFNPIFFMVLVHRFAHSTINPKLFHGSESHRQQVQTVTLTDIFTSLLEGKSKMGLQVTWALSCLTLFSSWCWFTDLLIQLLTPTFPWLGVPQTAGLERQSH